MFHIFGILWTFTPTNLHLASSAVARILKSVRPSGFLIIVLSVNKVLTIFCILTSFRVCLKRFGMYFTYCSIGVGSRAEYEGFSPSWTLRGISPVKMGQASHLHWFTCSSCNVQPCLWTDTWTTSARFWRFHLLSGSHCS